MTYIPGDTGMNPRWSSSFENKCPESGDMTGKMSACWEIPPVGIGKWPEKFQYGGKFPSGERNCLPVHGTLSTAASVVVAGISPPLFYQCRINGVTRFYFAG